MIDIDYNNFLNYKLKNIKEQKLFQVIQKILSNNNMTLRNKQRKIEKLMNIYNLNKKEQLYELNPFWTNVIVSNFNSELLTFTNEYNSINFKNLFKKDFFITQLHSNFLDYEIFNIIIYSFFKDLKESHKDRNVFLNDIITTILDYYNHIIKLIIFDENKSNILPNFKIKNYEKFLNDKEKNYIKTYKKDFVWHYDTIILEYLNITLSKDIDKRFKKFIDINNKFKEIYKNSEKDIYIKIYRFIEYIFEHILYNKNIKIFENFIGKIGNRSYDYMHIYNVKIFNLIQNTYYLLSLIPMVYQPRDWNKKGKYGGFLNNKNDIIPLIKKMPMGISNIKYDNYFIDSINILQKKEYYIDKDFLNYIKTYFFKKEKGIPSYFEIYELYLDMQKKEKIIKDKNIYMYLKELISLQSTKEYEKSTLLEREKKINLLKDYYKIKDKDLDIYKSYKDSKILYYKKYNIFKEYNLIINFSELLINFKLYVPNKCDWRGRIYPLLKILHRTSGIYKNLLISDTEQTNFFDKNNRKEYILLLKEYIVMLYKPDFITYKEYFIKQDLYNWFDKNINENNKDKCMKIYIFLLEFIKNNNKYFDSDNNIKDLTDIEKKIFNIINSSNNKHLIIFALKDYFGIFLNIIKYSNIMLDYDQSSSGPMIYSILSIDKKMGKLTNLLSEDKRYDLYNHFLKKFLEENKIYNDIFKRDNFAKKIIMPTFYNMGKKGIRKLLKELFNENNLLIKDLEKRKKNFDYIINIITNILSTEYTNTIIYQKNLIGICRILYNNNLDIKFNTLEGSFISYRYIKFKQKYGSIKKNKTKRKSYRIRLPIDKAQNNLHEKHYTNFPPNFIQSIDAAICRIIINLFYKIKGEILETLHDSFRIGFKNIIILKNIIKYTYLYVFFNKYFHKYKIGLENNCFNITKNSNNYNLYKEYFYYEHIQNENNDIVYNFFINNINVNLETKKEIDMLYKNRQKKIDKWKDSDIDKILKSDFFFYF